MNSSACATIVTQASSFVHRTQQQPCYPSPPPCPLKSTLGKQDAWKIIALQKRLLLTLSFLLSIFNSMTVDQELPLGLEAQPKQHSSPRAEVLPGAKQVKADMSKKLNNSEKIPNKPTLEQTLLDENSRMLLDIDINSHFTPPVEEEITDEEGGDRIVGNSKQGTKLESSMIKAVSDKLTARQGRVLLPLSSVGVPSDRQSKAKLHHCMNSIPRNLDLGVAMEPVEVVSVTPTPTGTPREEPQQEPQDSQLCALVSSSLDVTLAASELVSPSDDQMKQYWPVRGHMTSALR